MGNKIVEGLIAILLVVVLIYLIGPLLAGLIFAGLILKEPTEGVSEESTEELIDESTEEVDTTTFSGTGSTIIPKVSLEKGEAMFRMTYDGDSHFSCFKVYLLNVEGNRVKPIVDANGEFNGVKIVSIEKQGDYMLEVNADGEWTIAIEQR